MIKGVLVSVLVVVSAVALGLYIDYNNAFTGTAPSPIMQWWGEGKPRLDDGIIKPFKINFPKELLDDLHHRLSNTRPFHPPLDDMGFQYGFNTEFLQTVLDFWRTKYSWEERQNYLNSLPQYTMETQGLQIHFIHVKPKNAKGLHVYPLLLVHGWPGSVREFYDIIPLLTTPREGQDFVFEVVAPSLPGYGFSQATTRHGLGPAQVAVVLRTLMKQLGHKRYYVQGGDWGSIIVTLLAQMTRGDRILGLHTNMAYVMPTTGMMAWQIIGSWYPSLIGDETEQKYVYPMSDHYSFLLEESGYLHLQATKPDTIGVALRDSPMGLAAYILEKFSTWTDRSWKSLKDGGLLKKFKLEALLDNVMIYWMTGTITTSMRLYSEHFNRTHRALGFDQAPVKVPTAIARFPNELAHQPRCFLEKKFTNLVQVTDMPTGGHFAAFEEPKLLADDIWDFVSALHHKST
uniref:Epoxide hydrolase n=1 Tax=Homalodisca liturata TaxID=320908 RepID=A0A1B6JZ18_9HEMI